MMHRHTMSLLRSCRPIALLGLGLLMLDPSQAFQLGLKDRQPGALRSIGTRRRLGLTRMQAAGEDDWESKQGEEARRKRVMQMQREITEDILAVSEEEREARKQKSLKERLAARKAIYQAYANVGDQQSLSINQIGLPKKGAAGMKAGFIEDPDRVIDPGVSFAERKARLLFDSLWIAVLGLALTWGVSSYQASISYLLGAGLGFGYVTLLSRFVESLGRGGPGSGVGSARFAMVILLVLLAGKYRDTIQVIPSVIGFFMYQVASFLQAFDPPKDDDEEEEGAAE